MQRALGGRHRLADDGLHGVAAAAELLDAALELLAVALGLAQVLLEALLVGRLGGHPDMGLEGGFQLPLLAVGLIQVLDELGVALVQIWHLRSHLPGS